jgi:uncharacterized membrane protein HdeD (DUF308 family)
MPRRLSDVGKEGDMHDTLLHNWSLLALRGAAAVAFGALAILWPAITLATLAALFAAFALLAGAVWTFGALRHRQADPRWWVLLLLGLFSMGAGCVAALYPALTTVALIVLVGANALVTGVLDIAVALRMRQVLRGALLLMLAGAASVLFGLVVLLFPLGAGAIALAFMIGLYALATGTMLLTLAFQVRAWSRRYGAQAALSADQPSRSR